MIRLYQGTGSAEIELVRKCSEEEWARLRSLTIRLLKARRKIEEVEILEKYPFELYEGTNFFGDEYHLLFFQADLEIYVELAELERNHRFRTQFETIAETITELGTYIRFIAVDIKREEDYILPQPDIKVSDESIDQAVADAEALIKTRGPISAVDRIHTGLHGYLRRLCEEAGIKVNDSWEVTKLFKELRLNHPMLNDNNEVQKRILNSLAAIVDAVNYIRNHHSLVHPNKDLIDEPGAILVINSVRTIIRYLNQKL